MKKYTAVIPVKKNSSRLTNKNILPFADDNLLVHKIKQLKKVKEIGRIIVSSDSDEMLELAITNGVEGIKRPADLADETRPLSDFFDYIATLIDDGYLVWTCCTSPIFDEANIQNAIDIWNKIDDQAFDSLITVAKFKHYLMDEHGPHNYKLGEAHTNSQDLPDLHLFTNGMLIADISNVKKWRYNYGPKAYRMEVTQIESIDIDTKEDYETAKCFYKLKQELKNEQ